MTSEMELKFLRAVSQLERHPELRIPIEQLIIAAIGAGNWNTLVPAEKTAQVIAILAQRYGLEIVSGQNIQ